MRRFRRLFAITGLCGWAALAAVLGAAPPSAAAPPSQPMRDLVRADRPTLDALYAGGSVGDIPTGFLPGRAIPDPGSRTTAAKSRLIHAVWQGKIFHGDGTGHNKVFGRQAVPVRVYHGESWRDGGPAVIVDYEGTSRLFGNVRDEFREVGPGLYLGLTWVRKPTGPELTTMFTLQDRGPARR
ncbi:MAG: hypothetical protein C0501_12870 [Isosphaera sp.]|nr:hypothetical protein [Isosphaera sp.]